MIEGARRSVEGKNGDISTIWRPFAGIETLHQQFCCIPQRMMTILVIQRVNLFMILKVPKVVRMSVCGLFSTMETLDGESSIFLIPLPYL